MKAPTHPLRRLAVVLTACVAIFHFLVPETSAQTAEVRYGGQAVVGDGLARTYLILDPDGEPLELGFALSPEALAGLPGPVEGPPEASTVLWDLALPEGTPAPYRLLSMDYNPLGHGPPAIYDVPHFDFHFYILSPEERDAILPEDPDYEAKSTRAPDSTMMPVGLVSPPGTTVPRMGTHWLDPDSHEFHGEPFDHTFIYGTWDGAVAFVEPMITLAFLEGKPDVSVDVPVPDRAATPGLYPTRYVVRWDPDAQETRVGITGFVHRE